MDIKSVVFARAAYGPADFLRDGRPQFAVVGRSNVGKSSLINALVNRKAVARVSRTPGKTQAVQFYLVNDRFYIVDLPGYGYARLSRSIVASWGDLVRGYLEDCAESIRLILLLIDVRRVPGEHDIQMHDWIRHAGIDERIPLTKSDKLSNSQLIKAKDSIAAALEVAPDTLLPVSALTRKGIDVIRREISTRL